jgi:hypothetical protein
MKMRISEDKEYYLDYYFTSIRNAKGDLRISVLKYMAEMKGEGAEYISCSFDPDDEDYVEGKVTLLFWKPADDEDTMVYVDNSIFYQRLTEVCENHVAKYPEDTEKVQGYLSQIKIHLSKSG